MKAEKLYAILLRLYPAEFRESYQHEMRATFRRRYRDEHRMLGRLFLGFSVAADTLLTAAQEHWDMLIHDIRYSLRAMRNSPVFAAAVLVTLALGIGATTAIYSLTYTVLLRPLPYSEPDRLVRIWEANQSRNIPQFAASLLNFLSWQEESKSFESMAAMRNESANLTGDGEPQRVKATAVSASFWTLMGLQPLAGRAFTLTEGESGKDRVAIISEGLWQQRYGGDPGIIGRSILVNGEPRVVVGIAPQDVGFTATVDLWTPLVPKPAEENRGNHVIGVVGRLRPGILPAQADKELNAIAASLGQRFPDSNKGWSVTLMPVDEWIVDSDSRNHLYLLMAAVVLLLLATCANVAGLLVTRASARAHEFGVRLALGAGRARIVRQLTVESLVLASIGGGLGILTAFGAVRWLAARVVNQLPRSANLSLDWPVLIFAVGLTTVVGLLFGLAPSWLVRRADIMSPLRKTGRGMVGSTGMVLRPVLVGAQVAVAAMLVVGALLLIQSFARLQNLDLGFRPDHLLTASVSLPPAKYPTSEQAESFYRALVSEVERIPGVVSAGLTSGLPLAGSVTSMSIAPIETQAQRIQVVWRMTDPDYFNTLQVPLKRGRFFNATDRAQPTPPAVILSETLARHLWPDTEDVIGRNVSIGGGDVASLGIPVVGIVGDMQLDLESGPLSAMYFPPLYGPRTLTLAVRTTASPAAITGALRAAVKRIDPAQPLFDIRTMDRIVDDSADRPRLQTTLLTAFAMLALLLGAVGVAGVVAYTVERRAPELAVRLALGSTTGQAMLTAARGGLFASAIGLVMGLAIAWGLSRYWSDLLFQMYQVRPDAPWTFAGVGTALLAVTLLAALLPARRATLIDPAVALRKD
ncbi:MAG TPA: ABC transporter permease [Terriglobia bacterium]|nr:ABC transporter permease [Terriglobia bacterium]